MLRLILAAVMIALAPAAYAADAAQMEANKKVVLQLYEAAINQKDFDAAAKFLGPHYIQHNPRAADGAEGLKAFPRLPARKISRLPQRHQTGVRRRRLCDPARSQRADARQPRQRHRRHFPAGKRQGRRALGRAPGNSRAGRQFQYDVLEQLPARPRARRGPSRLTARLKCSRWIPACAGMSGRYRFARRFNRLSSARRRRAPLASPGPDRSRRRCRWRASRRAACARG